MQKAAPFIILVALRTLAQAAKYEEQEWDHAVYVKLIGDNMSVLCCTACCAAPM